MTDDLASAIRATLPEIVALRHELHAHPELAFEEQWTSDRIARFLGEAGISCKRGYVGGPGLVATLAGPGEKTIALRADMDALAVQERTQRPYASTVPERMHACGHDGHMAALCGAAKVLAHGPSLDGTVKFIFQPAEEAAGGGQQMVGEGVLDDVDAVFALHAWPALDAGHVGVCDGTIMGAAHWFHIEVRGQGCHGAEPAEGVDPVVVAAYITTALQTITSREIDPAHAAVVTVGRIAAGTAGNVIPDAAVLEGTIRALTLEDAQTMTEAVQRIAEHTAGALRATVEVEFGDRAYPPTVNDPAMTQFVRETVCETLGPDKLVEITRPAMTAEDFAFYLQQAPGALVWLGNAPGPGALHSPCFDFNDDALPAAMTLLTHLAVRFLGVAGDH